MARLLATCILILAPLFAAGSAPAQTRAEIRDRVFVTAQEAASSVAGRALAEAAGRIAAGSDDLATLLRERQDIVDRRRRLQDDLAAAVLQSGSEAEAEVARIEVAEAGAATRIAELDERLERDFPDFKNLTNPSPMTRAEVQAVLADDEALLMTLTDEAVVYVWAISKTSAGWTRAEIGRAALADKVRLLRQDLSGAADTRTAEPLTPGFVRSASAFNRTLAYEIYRDLFAPLEPVFGAATQIMIVADGPLTSLPLGVLVTGAPEGSDSDAGDLRATPWMIRSHALTTLPSVSSLRVLRRALPVRKGEVVPFIGFGDPLLGYRLAEGGGDVPGLQTASAGSAAPVINRGVYEEVRRVADLAPLPNTARELRKLAATMGMDGSALFLGAAATERAVKSTDLSRVEILAFSTHGLLTGGLPGLDEPALVFTPPEAPDATDDALLTASEAAQLNLSASLIILSACDTAGSDGTPGAEGLSGLARAFIYAGARAILVSHWPVDDYAASVLTTGMLDRIHGERHLSRAAALQSAMIELMDDRSEDRFAHPRLWAPFVVVGEGGADIRG